MNTHPSLADKLKFSDETLKKERRNGNDRSLLLYLRTLGTMVCVRWLDIASFSHYDQRLNKDHVQTSIKIYVWLLLLSNTLLHGAM